MSIYHVLGITNILDNIISYLDNDITLYIIVLNLTNETDIYDKVIGNIIRSKMLNQILTYPDYIISNKFVRHNEFYKLYQQHNNNEYEYIQHIQCEKCKNINDDGYAILIKTCDEIQNIENYCDVVNILRKGIYDIYEKTHELIRCICIVL